MTTLNAIASEIPGTVVALTSSTAAPAELRRFINGAGCHPDFDFMRYWWASSDNRPGIAPWIQKKLTPGSDPEFGQALRADLVLPKAASGEYMNLAFLLDRFDRTLPSYEQHAFVQMKFTLLGDEPLHVGWERVRAFALQYLAGERRLAAVLVLHNPGVAGSGNAPHIHVIVPARQLTANGFGATDKGLCSDRGQEECWAAWQVLIGKGGAA